jgi:hypothetical protein
LPREEPGAEKVGSFDLALVDGAKEVLFDDVRLSFLNT